MKTTAKILLGAAALGAGYLIYKKLRKPKPSAPAPTTNGPQMGDGGLTPQSDDINVAPDIGCSGVYNNSCGNINWPNVALNMYCCGEQVYRFQRALNEYQSFGLVEDGKYGNQTRLAHETVLSQQATPPNFPGVNFSF